ncbi:DUF2071 domain-containing protein [Adhaeretor mobilis]|uniref:DUF2071 domain-containing protein n=1 Tax=Adhaeretor mobilis TaxID=1930276 RepID=A0A517N359_9BACT|nr:DUF2071 domain-containing protein [Adhaeretor mobilis]QDT01566.1 hypothetical protein HG15A2_49130 [Adhaeretor mobilis]
MRLPTIRAIIDRRVLVNFRVQPDRLAALLPPPFEPQLVGGHGIAGICLIRLKHVRPQGLPAWVGVSSENAAHRIAVQWEDDGQVRTGVYIPRRDTDSRINAWLGGRAFPGQHHFSHFEVNEQFDADLGDKKPKDRVNVAMHSADNSASVLVEGTATDKLPDDSLFDSVEHVSQFFEAGSLGYSPAIKSGEYDGLELRTFNWHVQPLAVTRVESSLFDDRAQFPPGTATFDNALLMRGIDHQWHSRESICCEAISK